MTKLALKTNRTSKIVELYEALDLGVEDIAEDLEVSVEEVKETLRAGSEDYLEDVRNGAEVVGDLSSYYENMRGIAFASEDDKTRLEATKYLIEEATGRNQKRVDNAGKMVVMPQRSNVIDVFNESLKKGNAAVNGGGFIEIAEVSGE